MFYNVSIDVAEDGSAVSIPELEKQIQRFWSDSEVFKRTLDKTSLGKPYIMYDGPPFATGLPHYGHVLAHTLKDVIPRYKTMQGFYVDRRFGWDCHGVPVEFEVQKSNSITNVTSYGVGPFNELCRSIVLRYTREWKVTEERLGRFVDMENDYKTMNPDFMESVWAVFKRIYDKGLIYEGKRIIAYSPALGTPLSDFEAKLNYKSVQDPAVTLSFPLTSDPSTSFLIWTTTPWTIPTNVAIAVNPALIYERVTLKSGASYIIAHARVASCFKEEDIISSEVVPASSLIGLSYQPMFHLDASVDVSSCYYIIPSDHVTDEDGTGLVHISPAFGEDDYRLGLAYRLPVIDFCDDKGCFSDALPRPISDSVPFYSELRDKIVGMSFKESDSPIIAYMKRLDRVVKHDSIHHEYPLCWRTDSPLMYRAVSSWYVNVTSVKDRLLANNKKISWYPGFAGEKRFNEWLEKARDWGISRNRFWGTPIPVWRNVEDQSDVIVIGSIEELRHLTGVTDITDIHSHNIDHLIINKEGKTYKRISEVLDCWFESGAMPYAQAHYPFEGESEFLSRGFPADFIAEGLDQTRGWFYTLMVLSTILFDKPAFTHCMVNGIILGDDGKKMSKSKRNYPALDKVFDEYGADALRFLLMASPATQARQMAISESAIKSVTSQVLIPLLNIYKFFAKKSVYFGFFASDLFDFSGLTNPINRALAYRTELFRLSVTDSYERYDLMKVCESIREMLLYLSNWYVRSIKHILLPHLSSDSDETLSTLHKSLEIFLLCSAPIIPFMTDLIYKNLFVMEVSIHLSSWPNTPLNVSEYQHDFEAIQLVLDVISLGRQARDQTRHRLRQPLQMVHLPVKYAEVLLPYKILICQELNVDDINWVNSSEEVSKRQVQLDGKILGPKYRKQLVDIKREIDAGRYTLSPEGLLVMDFCLLPGEFSYNLVPARDGFAISANDSGSIWVGLSTDITPELVERGYLRDAIHTIQMLRKQHAFEPTDPIRVLITGPLGLLVEKYREIFSEKISSEFFSRDLTEEETTNFCCYREHFSIDSIEGDIILVALAREKGSKVLHSSTTVGFFRDSGASAGAGAGASAGAGAGASAGAGAGASAGGSEGSDYTQVLSRRK